MYHVEECVKSLHHGLGVVITAGENPRVRFNVGGDIFVDGDTLQVIPGKIYDKAIRNRDEVDRWTSWRVDGYANGEPFRLPSPDTDSTEQPVESEEQGYLPRRVEAPSEVGYFIADGPKGLRRRRGY